MSESQSRILSEAKFLFSYDPVKPDKLCVSKIHTGPEIKQKTLEGRNWNKERNKVSQANSKPIGKF